MASQSVPWKWFPQSTEEEHLQGEMTMPEGTAAGTLWRNMGWGGCRGNKPQATAVEGQGIKAPKIIKVGSAEENQCSRPQWMKTEVLWRAASSPNHLNAAKFVNAALGNRTGKKNQRKKVFLTCYSEAMLCFTDGFFPSSTGSLYILSYFLCHRYSGTQNRFNLISTQRSVPDLPSPANKLVYWLEYAPCPQWGWLHAHALLTHPGICSLFLLVCQDAFIINFVSFSKACSLCEAWDSTLHFGAQVSGLPCSNHIWVLDAKPLILLCLKPCSACTLASAYSLVPDCTLKYQVQDLLPTHTPQEKKKLQKLLLAESFECCSRLAMSGLPCFVSSVVFLELRF